MMQSKRTDDIQKINTLLANCNQNFVTCPFSGQKNAQILWMALKCRIMNFVVVLDGLSTSLVLKLWLL